MKFNNIKAVSIFGYANSQQNEDLYKNAFEVSRVLAENGLEIVNGGGPGVMRAATEGAHAGEGRVTVATFYPKFIENFEGKDKLNKADKEIVMNNYVDRTMKLLELGNAYVIFNGGTGTLSEFGMAWGLAYLYFGHHKPLILYGEFWHEITEALAKNMLISDARPGALRVYKIATNPEMVVDYLLEFDQELGVREEVRKDLVSDNGEEAFFEG
jgi:uncharacterized protein (TIGR00730 family)